VKFGISPFGIWRNKAADPPGSDTNGTAPGQAYPYVVTGLDRVWHESAPSVGRFVTG